MKKHIIILFLFLSFNSFTQVKTEITGYVKDKTDLPLIGASVYLENTTNGATTDANGYYSITNVTPNTYNLVVSYLGYDGQTRYNIEVKSVGNQLYNFILLEQNQNLSEIVVSNKNKVTRPRETPLSTQTLSAVEIATYPGGNNDVVRVAQSLPGISPSTGGFRNDLIIRGGAPNEAVYYLDGVEIPNINHFSTQGSSGGPVGMLNVSFIDDVSLATSAFGSQYDNPLSGVLQFSQREGNNRKHNTNFRLSASEAAITHEGPLFKGKNKESKTSYIISARRSYLQFLFKMIGLPIRPDYWDYQYKITHKIDKYNTLNLIGLGSIDEFEIDASGTIDEDEQSTLDQTPFIEQRTNTIGLSWKNRFKNGKGFMQTTISNNLLVNDFSRYKDNENQKDLYFKNDSREMETKLRYSLTYYTKDWRLVGGFNTQRSDYKNKTIDTNEGFQYNTKINFMKYGLFANATKSFFDQRLDFSFGFRTDGDSFTQGNDLLSTFSPRLALSYEFIDDWKIKASVGRYFKLPPYTILGYKENDVFLNKNINYTQSDHYVLGIERILGPSSNISVEGFYKRYEDYPVSVRDQVSLANKGADFNVLGNEEVKSVGKGRAYGLEFLFQQKLSHRFYGIFSYTFFYSEFTGFDRSKYLPSVWDSRHLISFTGGYKLKKNWEVSARYRFAGGTPIVPVNTEATTARYPDIVLDYNRLGEDKLGVFSQLDVRIDKKWNFKKLSVDLFFEIQNILMHKSPETPEYVIQRDDKGNITEPRNLVQLAEEDGKSIPTIGIVIDF
ncbi:TonB-dependent receptor [Ancylomarina sp. 16SWW S1-10-2]|uniref:TonB-dependent receptor n=1 Tax=Ancylomarina sp. 16SWW S1-10-2 TaxID=2499681 RepID=UPI0012AE627E|nr:TonB-dependent receptor [Ancylomarina sp. 16SWW S1-10-2]MRT94476.1 TonB-dependent receptor [Ancylomarina sp. 16SWW S1-10-2]